MLRPFAALGWTLNGQAIPPWLLSNPTVTSAESRLRCLGSCELTPPAIVPPGMPLLRSPASSMLLNAVGILQFLPYLISQQHLA